jgi:hypothetical protein
MMSLNIRVDVPHPAPALSPENRQALFDALLENPWQARLIEMRFALDGPFEPLDIPRVIAASARGYEAELTEGDDKADPIVARIRTQEWPWAAIYVDEPRFDARRVRDVLDAMLAAMPSDARALVRVDSLVDDEWFERMDIPLLPEAIFKAGLPWLVAVAPAQLGEIRDDLFVSSELRNGRRWLQLYDDPFDVESEDTRRRIERIASNLAS